MRLATRALEDVGFWKSLLLDVTIKGGALSKGDLAAFGSALHRCGNELAGAQGLLEALPVGSAARAKAEDVLHSTTELYIEASDAYTSALNRRNDRIKQELSIIKPESERLNREAGRLLAEAKTATTPEARQQARERAAVIRCDLDRLAAVRDAVA